MAEYGDRTARHHGQGLHVHGEGIDLYTVNLVASECAGQGIYADIFRLNVARGFIELPVKIGDFDSAALAECTDYRVLAKLAENVQAALNQVAEFQSVMSGNRREPPVQSSFSSSAPT